MAIFVVLLKVVSTRNDAGLWLFCFRYEHLPLQTAFILSINLMTSYAEKPYYKELCAASGARDEALGSTEHRNG